MKPTATIRERLEVAHDAAVLAQASLVTLQHPQATALVDPSSITEAAERATREVRTQLFYLSSNLPDCVLDAKLDENDFEGSAVVEALRRALQPTQKPSRPAKAKGGAR